MTERKHFKQLVRARAAKTGESYSTARRQIIRQADANPSPAGIPHHFPGSIATASALRSQLAQAGVRAPHTERPFSEAMVFGIAGGIGAGMFTFHYAKENHSSFFVAGAHLWQDHLAWAEAAVRRFGRKAVTRESSGSKPGEKNLRELLEGGRPVLTWLNGSLLPHRAQAGGIMYHVATVYGLDDASGTALIGDLTDEPVTVPLAGLAQARGSIKNYKHQVLALGPGGKTPALDQLVREGVGACVAALTKGRMKNFTLEAFRTWATRLDGSGSADSWEKLFPPGPNLFRALAGITEYVEYYGTGGGLCRPMFAEFLEEASAALSDPRLGKVAAFYAELGREWSALADAALPDSEPLFREVKQILARRSELIHAEGPEAAPGISACSAALSQTGKAFPLDDAGSTALRRELQRRVTAICEKEQAGLAALQGWLRG
jgi:hypothetical protein